MERKNATIGAKKTVSIQEYVTSAAISLISLYSQEVEKVSLSEASQNRLAMLRETGLTLSETYKSQEEEETAVREQNQWVEQIREGVKFLRGSLRYFGTGVRLITYDDFDSLISKYGLAVAPLVFYKGSIPDENLRAAAQATNTLAHISKNGVVGRHIKRAAYEKGYNRVRFLKPNESFYKWDYVESKMYIAAPKGDIDFDSLGRTPYGLKDAMGLDPLVYTYTDFGVLIFTAWGEEADDAVFEKYEALNGAIQNLPNKSLSARVGGALGCAKKSIGEHIGVILFFVILATVVGLVVWGAIYLIGQGKEGDAIGLIGASAILGLGVIGGLCECTKR